MHQVKKITPNLYWIGGNNRRLALFENVFPIPRGVSYNSYLLLDDKNILFDTVDISVSSVFYENISFLLKDKKLDYVIVNHVEPDHCASLEGIIRHFPEIKIIGNKKTAEFLCRFFTFERYGYDFIHNFVTVNEGDTIDCGNHTLTFVMAPMVHWPEVMVTYEINNKILFSADAFGTFGALNGHIFADEFDFEHEWINDARRYYTNIVGKYGNQVQTVLAKAAKLDISTVCPLHGPVWRKNFSYFLDKYMHWSAYIPEDISVMIAYGSIYGNTENAVTILASALAEKGVRNIKMFDVSVTHPSEIVAEAFRCSHLVFASSTYNAGIFCNMETLVEHLFAHNLQNRTVAFIENGSWAPESARLLKKRFLEMRSMTILDMAITIKSTVKEPEYNQILKLADLIFSSMPLNKITEYNIDKNAGQIQNDAFFKLTYGLFMLSVKDGDKDNACIVNTVIQITAAPMRVAIAVNKANFTHDIMQKTKLCNISILSTDTQFDFFKRYGFQSGRNTNKFVGINLKRSTNDIVYDDMTSCAFISANVVGMNDWGSHTLFVADVTEAAVLSNTPPLTYAYYFERIKPKPAIIDKNKKGWVCKICGYIHEDENLPEDYICPLCKHGAADFEKLH